MTAVTEQFPRECRYGQMFFDPEAGAIGRSLHSYGEYAQCHLSLFDQVLKPDSWVLEVGADVGSHTLYFAKKLGPLGNVVAFESRNNQFKYLQANIEINGITNTVCRQSSLVRSKPTDARSAHSDTFNSERRHLSEEANLDVATLDRQQIARCDLIKIDAPLTANEILGGAQNTIKRNRPLLFISDVREQTRPDLLMLIDSFGYEIYPHTGSLFNPSNFRANDRNIFSGRTLQSLICVSAGPKHRLIGFERLKVSNKTQVPIGTAMDQVVEREVLHPDEASPASEANSDECKLLALWDLKVLEGKVQDHVRGDQPEPTKPFDLELTFQEMLSSVDYVSFDVFDTLILRDVSHPRDVFLHLSECGAVLSDPPLSAIHDLRQEAENRARRVAWNCRRTGEVTLPEIYETFCHMVEYPLARVAELVDAEEKAEVALCRPNPYVQRLYQIASQRGKRVLILSDTYHRHQFVVQLLAANGYAVAPESVYTSSERRVNKQGGYLFQQVINNLRISPEKILHVGDHPLSDYHIPKSMGMRAILHSCRASWGSPTRTADRTGKTESFIRSVTAFARSCNPQPERFWYLLGHNLFGPLLCGFCDWLHTQMHKDGVQRAWFLLRDGEIFHRVYSALFDGKRDSIETRTLPASRRAFVLPLLESQPDFVQRAILAGHGSHPVGEYLSRLCIPSLQFREEIRSCGFRGDYEVADSRVKREQLLRLLQVPRIHAALLERSKEERHCVLAYLKSENFFDDCRTAIIDLGWHGTIQKAIHFLAMDGSKPPAMIGYYLATFSAFTNCLPEALRASAFLTEIHRRLPVVDTLILFPELLEIVCSSSGGSLWHFRDNNGKCEPVFLPNPASAAQLRQLAEVHEGILAFAAEFQDRRARGVVHQISPRIASEELLRVLATPTKQEAVLLGGLTHCDDMGSLNQRYPARFRPDSVTIESLLQDFDNATWKPGLVSQPGLQCALLRTIRWLMRD